MESREAFAAIERKLRADPRKNVVEAFYDAQAFGNFSVSYEERGEQLSVVNDRGQLFLYDGAAGGGPQDNPDREPDWA